MSDIFISYNNQDRHRAQLFAHALEQRGWSIFWDPDIRAGKRWLDSISRELSEARCVIVLWSKNSVSSQWVRDEAEDAKQRDILVPVRIDNVEPPLGFRGIQTANLTNWNAAQPTLAFDRLIADITALIGSPSKEAGGQLARANNVARHKAAYEDAKGENYRASPSPSATSLVEGTATPAPSVLAAETKQPRLHLALKGMISGLMVFFPFVIFPTIALFFGAIHFQSEFTGVIIVALFSIFTFVTTAVYINESKTNGYYLLVVWIVIFGVSWIILCLVFMKYNIPYDPFVLAIVSFLLTAPSSALSYRAMFVW
jgi:hypothetical protein